MSDATRAGAIALATCLMCQIVSAQAASPDSQSKPVKGTVQLTLAGIEGDGLNVSGETMCAAARVWVTVEGLGGGRTPPTVTASLAGSASSPPGVTIAVDSLKDSGQVTDSPGDFTFRVCAAGLPPGVASGTMTLHAAVLKVSPEGEWRVRDPRPGADSITFTVNAGQETISEKPELRLIVTPVNLQMAKQSGEAVFEFDVAASKGFAGMVVGSVSITQPANLDEVELVEGTNSGSLSFRLGAGQKLSDAQHLRYRIRTSKDNPHGGVLVYGITLNADGDQFTPQDAAGQVRVKVGGGAGQ